MADEPNKAQPQKLSERIENHRREIQYLIRQGGEQPQYEFKRTVSLGRDSLDDRLDFVKLIQAVANAEIATERCIVVGADPKEKKFYAVTNVAEFDPANLSRILSVYLDPLPRFQVFNLTADDNQPFVLIVLDANQPRPIFITKAGQTEKGKTRLEIGDVWIKKNTDTVRVTRADIDLMYRVRMEEEAEDRARKRIKHLLELNPAASAPRSSELAIPSFALLVGPKDDLRKFLDEMIVRDDERRFRMLLEVAREILVEGWDKFGISDATRNQPVDLSQFQNDASDFYQNQFMPAFETVVEVGLLMVKHSANQAFVEAVVDLLVEAFEASRTLTRLPYRAILQNNSVLPWWKPGSEVYMGLRAIAIYTVIRNRLAFLDTILPRFVPQLGPNDLPSKKTPIMFWPFYPSSFVSDEFKNGRAQYFWKERIAAAWANYFGSISKFLAGSSQLEFVLELNSYLGTNTPKDPKLGELLKTFVGDEIQFGYIPDLYADDLQSTVPMAERIYDIIAAGTWTLSHLFIDRRMAEQFFGNIPTASRLERYGGFLRHLKSWQQSYRFEALGRWDFMWDWIGRLKIIAQAAEAQKVKGG